MRWRVLRAVREYAEDAFDDTVVGNGQTLLSDKPASGARDDHLSPGATHFYTIFAEDRHGDWHRVAKSKMTVDDSRLERRAEADFEAGGSRPGSQNPHALDIANSGLTPR